MTSRTFRPQTSRRGVFSRVAAGVAVASIALTGAVVVMAPAQAAGLGAGFGPANDYLGGYVAPDGSIVYCIDPGIDSPSPGTTTDAGLAGAGFTASSQTGSGGAGPTNTLDADTAARINYVVSTYGQTWDNVEAAAVHFVVQYLGNPHGMFATSKYNGPHTLESFINYTAFSSSNGNSGAIQARARAIVDAAMTITAAPTNGGTGQLDFAVDPVNNYAGTVAMNGTTGASGTITLVNGVFVDTGTSTISGATTGTSYQVRGVVPEVGAAADQAGTRYVEGGTYKIWGSGTFTAPGDGFAPNVHLWNTGSQQRTVGPGEKSLSQFNVAGEDPVTRGVQFLPVLGTSAPRFHEAGEAMTDEVTFSTVTDDNGVNNPWASNPNTGYVPVTAEGTLYGPFASQPAESAEVPADAPVAGTATITTSAADGPTVAYTGTSDEVIAESGFYTWVWSVDWHSQSQRGQYYLPGPSPIHPTQDAYHFQDEFGQVVETSIVPSTITAVSEISSPTTPLSAVTVDAITVSSDGHWLQREGENIPVTFVGEAYFVPGEEAPAQVSSDAIPADAKSLGTVDITVTKPGTYSTPETLEDGGIQVPDAGIGHITWVWKVQDANQPEENREWLNEWSDDFGIPAETQRILQPEVSTLAQEEQWVGNSFTDIAYIEGTLPEGGAGLHFELYKATQDADGNWVCEAGNLLWTSEETWVTENGEYESAPAPGQAEGVYHWVEVLNGEKGGEIHRGECGLVNETTTVVPPTVETKSQAGAKLGETISDTAIVDGTLPEDGANLTFEAYKVPMVQDANGNWVADVPEAILDENGEPVIGENDLPVVPTAENLDWVCTTENVAYTDEEGQVVTEAGEFVSPEFAPEEYAKYLWVETLSWDKPVIDPVTSEPVLDEAGEPTTESVVIHRGDCGIPNETSFVLDVTTKAQSAAVAGEDTPAGAAYNGDTIWDEALATGYVPEGATIEFEVYNTNIHAPVCTEDTLKTTLASAEPITGGLHPADKPLAAKSVTWTVPSDVAVGSLVFVEVTRDAEGREVSRGDCADGSETLGAKGARIAAVIPSGGELNSALLCSAGGVLALGLIAGATLLLIRRRKASIDT